MGEKFNISWHTFEVHLKEMLQEMFMSPNFSDVTIVCDDQKKIKAHRNVLSASSPIFKNILQQHGEESKHPIIYLRGIQHSEMESIMQFVYYGQATFYQERINELLAVAKNLEIKGLSDVKMEYHNNDIEQNTIILRDKIKTLSETKHLPNQGSDPRADVNEHTLSDDLNETLTAAGEIENFEDFEVETMTPKPYLLAMSPAGQNPPPKYLVPEDLQNMIITNNQERRISFTLSQRNNTQMMMDEFLLKKKKGPFFSKGGRSINWRCVNAECSYSMNTWEGEIHEVGRTHNHESQPDLCIKKQIVAKLKENIDINDMNNEGEKISASTLVNDFAEETELFGGNLGALKQVARRFRRHQKSTANEESTTQNANESILS